MVRMLSVISGLGGSDCLHCWWVVGAMVPMVSVISGLAGSL